MNDRERVESDERSDDVLLARVFSGVAGVLLLFSLSLVWLDRSYSGEDVYYTGWSMLAGGLGLSDRTLYLCGSETCAASESFNDGAVPTLAVGVAAVLLLVAMARWSRVLGRFATGFCVLSLFALAGHILGPDQNDHRSGLIAVLLGLVTGLASLWWLARDRARRELAG